MVVAASDAIAATATDSDALPAALLARTPEAARAAPLVASATSALPATPADTDATRAAPSTIASPATADFTPDIGNAGLRQAALAGDPAAAYEIGLRYAEGTDVAPDAPRAARWFARAAAHGSVPATYRLAVLLDHGAEGLPRDVPRARALYAAAAGAGNVKAMHNYAVMLGEDGPDADPRGAAQWYRRAAERGVRDSQYNLGVLHARGIGVERDLAAAWRWFAIAAAQGDPEAARRRDEIAARLDPAQLAQARLEAARFQPVQASHPANVAARDPAWDRADPNGALSRS
nr:tetratricopeptide repeat protein [Ancylobacter crimeensis]